MRLWLQPDGDPVALVRDAAAASDSLLMIIDACALDPVALALAKAAIGPLAIERAPSVRVNAVVLGASHRPADADATIAFLETARSTTGQVLEIS
jgi:hypothetical protein